MFMGDGEAATEQPPSTANTYTIVLRCPSSARFRPEEGQLVTLSGVPDLQGQVETRLRTRWLDQGHDAPLPRELWLEVRCESAALDLAISASTSVSRLLASIVAFTANVQCGAPEVHLAYDSTPGHSERDFMEVFLPDEQGHPREGRLVNTDEFTAIFEALDQSGDAAGRLSRALNQYELALRYWYFGGEYLSLSHLYMAVEALTTLVIRARCVADGVDEAELARRHGVDPDDPERPRWRPALDSWARRTLIFQADEGTYSAARSASDGVEHGFMEMNEVIKRAIAATEATFGYVRKAILNLLQIDEQRFPELYVRSPRDVQSLRKMVRGKFIGVQDDIAPPGEEYPHLEWRSGVRTFTRTGDEFALTFNEHFTVRCHPDVSFQGLAFEARGRLEAGQDPLAITVGQEIQQGSAVEEPPFDLVVIALDRAASFAAPIGKAIGERGMSPIQALSMFRFSMQLAVFESILTLLRDDRAPEALALMQGLIRNTCLLQLSSSEEHGPGIAIKSRLDALDRSVALYDDPMVTERVAQEREMLGRVAEASGVDLSEPLPELSTAPFFRDHTKDAALVQEIALSDVVAMQFHLEVLEDPPVFRTQGTDPRVRAGAASLAISAVTASAIALAEVCHFDYDQTAAHELLTLAETLDPEAGRPEPAEDYS